MGSFMNKHSHASNLLKYNAVDDKASALLSTGHGGKPNHNHDELEQLDPRRFNSRNDPNAAATDESEASIARRRKSDAIKAAKRAAARFAKTPAGRRKAREENNSQPFSTIKLNKKK
jgi:phage repressor protein C with HTH and peptisase S24 domain